MLIILSGSCQLKFFEHVWSKIRWVVPKKVTPGWTTLGPNSRKLMINLSKLGIIYYIKTCLCFTQVYCKFLRFWPLAAGAYI